MGCRAPSIATFLMAAPSRNRPIRPGGRTSLYGIVGACDRGLRPIEARTYRALPIAHRRMRSSVVGRQGAGKTARSAGSLDGPGRSQPGGRLLGCPTEEPHPLRRAQGRRAAAPGVGARRRSAWAAISDRARRAVRSRDRVSSSRARSRRLEPPLLVLLRQRRRAGSLRGGRRQGTSRARSGRGHGVSVAVSPPNGRRPRHLRAGIRTPTRRSVDPPACLGLARGSCTPPCP